MKSLTFPNFLSSQTYQAHDNLSVDFTVLGWHCGLAGNKCHVEDEVQCVFVDKLGIHTRMVPHLTETDDSFSLFYNLGSFSANPFFVGSALRHLHHWQTFKLQMKYLIKIQVSKFLLSMETYFCITREK